MIGKEYVQDEECDVESLEKKWIKTPSQSREIKVLEKYIDLKKELIENLIKWSKKEFGAKD